MQQIIITLAGPFAGFLLAALIIAGVILTGGSVAIGLLLGFIPIPQLTSLPIGGSLVGQFISLMLWVNVFWGLINLLPVFPLDGGQVARNVLIQYDPFGGARKSLWLSVITGGLMALVGLIVFRSIYMAFLFGLLAFQSYQALSVRY
jgi:Zn-dependent protease